MNIWLINHYAVPPQYYPLARQTYFAKHLMQMGHQVTIFAASSVHNSTLNLITDKRAWRKETVDGVSYVYIRCCNYEGNGVKRIYNMCEFAWKLSGVCRRFPKPDAIVATSMPPMSCAAGIRLARKYGCTGVAEIADLWPESIVAYGIAGARNPAVSLLRKLEKWIYTRSDAVVFTMEGAYDYIEEQGWEQNVPRSKVHFINNGVDLAAFHRHAEEWRLEDHDLDDAGTFKVVYAGSIRKVNNLGLLLDTAKEVKDPAVRFLIWGDGDERRMLERRVQDEQISNVVFKGRVEKKYIPSILQRGDLTLAHCEQTPVMRYGISFNKMFEYFAAGKPVLSDFACAYNPAVQYGAGTEVSDPTAENIAREIERYAALDAADYQAYVANAVQAAEAYDFARLTKRLESLLYSLQKANG